ncbi:MAG: TDP-N-acetylfucosamine:lipid II N-acetylfucosaminyltransferase [Ignavibacteriaceae bacterium]
MFVHIVFESDYAYVHNKMINKYFDSSEHLFLIVGRAMWDDTKEYTFINSIKVNSFDDREIVRILESCTGIIIHGLFFNQVIDYFFKSQHLLSKVHWVIWGGDVNFYREVGSPTNPYELEEKRKAIIKKIFMISAAVKDDYNVAKEVYKTEAGFMYGIYPALIDFDYLDTIKNKQKTTDEINILAGTSSTISNRHNEILELLSKFKDEKIKIYCPLVYGDKTLGEKVAALGHDLFGEKFVPLFKFQPFKEYADFLSTIDVVVLNHNRQQGVGNTINLLYLGKKVFLRKEIATFSHFTEKGVKLYNTSDIAGLDFKSFYKYNKVDAIKASKFLKDEYSFEKQASLWKDIFSNFKKQLKSDKKSEENNEDAKNKCYEILSEDPENSDAYYQLGDINYSLKNYEIALRNYKSAFQFSGDGLEAAFKIVLSYLAMSRLEEATKFLKKIIIKNPYDKNLLLLCKELNVTMEWDDIKEYSSLKLYAGDIPERDEYKKLIGLSIEKKDHRHILHDMTNPFPLKDNSVDSFQAEDVFEHIPYEKLPAVFDEIYRVLKPGATFRLSIPDYGCDILYERSLKDSSGKIIFDAGGGGTIENPGHLWFPVISNVEELLQKTEFVKSGIVDLLHYYNSDGSSVLNNIDYSKGFVARTPDNDKRVQSPRRPMSFVIDLIKSPAESSNLSLNINPDKVYQTNTNLIGLKNENDRTNDVPVILICYNRPWHTQQVLNSLKQNDIKNLYIFCDAPKTPKNIEEVNAVRNLIKSIDWTHPKVVYQTENQGLAKSIVTAANLVFEKYDRLVLLEDDCVPQKYFFDFMYTCLNKYEKNEKIYGISGYSIPIPNEILSEYPNDLYFCPRIGSWGWATWKRAWKHKINDLNFLNDELLKKNVDINQGGDDIPVMFEQMRNGSLKDVWTMSWLLSVYLNNGVYIYPTKSHIANIGLDGTGVHCGKTNKFDTVMALNKPSVYPADVVINKQLLQHFVNKHNLQESNPIPKTTSPEKREPNYKATALDVYKTILSKDLNKGNFNKLLNLGCGNRFHKDWVNVDFVSYSKEVMELDLKNPLPFSDGSFDVVYHSHILEHFQKAFAPKFLKNCFNVLRKGGIIRVVVPDLEQIAKYYLDLMGKSLTGDLNAQAKYDWIMLELFDQTVRNYSGGEMLKYWQQQEIPAEAFVVARMGSEAKDVINSVRKNRGQNNNGNGKEPDPTKIGKFRLSGEVHQWMYDRYSLSKLLKDAGFTNIKVTTAFESMIPNFNKYNLDIEPDNSIRKPDSLFMEAIK